MFDKLHDVKSHLSDMWPQLRLALLGQDAVCTRDIKKIVHRGPAAQSTTLSVSLTATTGPHGRIKELVTHAGKWKKGSSVGCFSGMENSQPVNHRESRAALSQEEKAPWKHVMPSHLSAYRIRILILLAFAHLKKKNCKAHIINYEEFNWIFPVHTIFKLNEYLNWQPV